MYDCEFLGEIFTCIQGGTFYDQVRVYLSGHAKLGSITDTNLYLKKFEIMYLYLKKIETRVLSTS